MSEQSLIGRFAGFLSDARAGFVGDVRQYRWAASIMFQIAPYLSTCLFVLGLLSGIAPLVLFIAIRGLIDTHFTLSATGSVHMDDMAPWFTLVMVVAVIEALVVLAKKKVASGLAASADSEITTKVLRKANQLDIAYFENRGNQEEIGQVQSHISGRLVTLVEKSADIFSALIQGFTLTSILVLIEPLLVPLVIPLFIPYMFFQLNLTKHKLLHRQQASESHRRISYYVDMLSNRASVAEVHLLGVADHMIERFQQALRTIRSRQRPQENLDFAGSTVFAVLSIAALFYVFRLVVESTVSEDASMGDLVVFAAAMIRLRNTMERFTVVMSVCVEELGHLRYLRSFLERQTAVSRKGEKKLQNFTGDVTIEGLSFSYPDTPGLVLDNLSLSIKAGETVALVGENGCGKSTLIKLIAGLYPDYAGSIRLSNQDIGDCEANDLRRNISFIFQDFARYAATAADNIAYGDWDRLQHDRAAVIRLAERLDLDATIRQMPDGYDTVLGRQFGDYEPSGGIWQRLAIARAFAGDAPLLVLDEPTANVDVKSEYELFNHLQGLANDRTTILVSHRFSTVSMADRIFVMKDGSIVEAGPHKELIDLQGYYAELYEYYRARMEIGG